MSIVDYLCRSGEPPCYFGMPEVNTNAATRRSAYIEAMNQFRLTPEIVELSDVTTWDFERFGFEEANRIFARGTGFASKTILCANDRVAFGVIAAAYQRGLKVGHGSDCDLLVAGHDDHPLSRYACPPITTVAQNYNEIGKLAIELLLGRMGETAERALTTAAEERILLSAEPMLRNSA